MRIHFLINPRAGRCRSAGLAAALRREFAGHEIAFSSDPRELMGTPTPDRVVAVGGDGTANLVINTCCARNQTILGILPRGTSNDLARALRIPGEFGAACAAIRGGRVTTIDLLSVNGLCFATGGGLGLGAAVAIRVNRWRNANGRTRIWHRALGRANYPLAALVESLHGCQPFRARLDCDGQLRMTHCATLLVNNQPDAGGFHTSPIACNSDGLLDLCEIAAPAHPGRMTWISLQALRGHIDQCHEVSQHRISMLRILADRSLPFFGDGEILCQARSFEIVVRHRALRVAVPPPAASQSAEESAQGVRHD